MATSTSVTAVDPFSTGKNGARYSLWSSIDSSFQEELIGTHIDHDFKIFGLDLASFPPHTSKCVKLAKFRCFHQFSGNFWLKKLSLGLFFADHMTAVA